MFAAVSRHTQAGIDRRKAEKRLARIEQDNAPAPVVRLVEPRRSHADELARQKRETAMDEAAERARAFREQFPDAQFRHTYTMIEKRLCRVFNVTRAELQSTRRHREIVLVRQAIMYWTCRLTKRSLPEIGRSMGGFDHTSVLHGKRVYPVKRAKMGRTLRAVR
jgi:chromosomal replication initiation ATPase DnaA